MTKPSSKSVPEATSQPVPDAPSGTLRRKLVRSVVFMLLLMGLLTLGVLAKLQIDRFEVDEQRLEQLIQENLSAKASQLTNAHADAMGILAADNALSDMQQLVQRTVSDDEDVVYGVFVKHSGAPLAFSSPEHPDGTRDPAVALSLLGLDLEAVKRRAVGQRELRRFGQPIVEFSAPVLEGKVVVGTLFYGVSAKRATEAVALARSQHAKSLRNALLQLLGVILLTTLAAVRYASRLARNVTHPIVRLTDAAKQLSAGQRAVRVSIHSGDEVQTLGASFNAMVSDLDRSYADLQASNRKLQQEMEERRRAEAERTAAQQELFQAQKMEAVGQLAGGVAHDFNNLLFAVQGNTELLEQLDSTPAARECTQAIKKAVSHGASLTRQLLTFSRRQNDEPHTIEPAEVVRDLQKLVRRVLAAHIDLEVVIGTDTPTVSMAPGRLEQVIMNLAVNARDALGANGKIRIVVGASNLRAPTHTRSGVAPPGCYLELVVEDNGTGMSSETCSRIFEPFFTTKEAGKGTGLGLATVHGIVGQANGHIDVVSTVGRGTRFSILIPAQHQVQSEAMPDATVTAVRGHGQRILLCEDDEVVRSVIERILCAHDYRVAAFVHPAEVMAAIDAKTMTPDLLVTDVVMPSMNGKELAEAVRARIPGIPVLFVSGYTAGLLQEQGIGDVSESLLRKPFSSQELLERTAALLAGPSSECRTRAQLRAGVAERHDADGVA